MSVLGLLRDDAGNGLLYAWVALKSQPGQQIHSSTANNQRDEEASNGLERIEIGQLPVVEWALAEHDQMGNDPTSRLLSRVFNNVVCILLLILFWLYFSQRRRHYFQAIFVSLAAPTPFIPTPLCWVPVCGAYYLQMLARWTLALRLLSIFAINTSQLPVAGFRCQFAFAWAGGVVADTDHLNLNPSPNESEILSVRSKTELFYFRNGKCIKCYYFGHVPGPELSCWRRLRGAIYWVQAHHKIGWVF